MDRRMGGHGGFRSVRFKMALLIGVVVAVLMLFDAAWSMHQESETARSDAQEKASVLAKEMRASWDFIDKNQEIINMNEDGSYRTKMLVCVVTAKSVAQLFGEDSDYTIRFVRENPRQSSATPDAFEEEALRSFQEDSGLESYSAVMKNESTGQDEFRYAEPLRATESCMTCHGDPAGELDQYGYAKEGMHVGDLAGCMSITEPMEIYTQAARENAEKQAAMTMLSIVIVSIAIYFFANHVVIRPIEKLGESAHRIRAGDFSIIRSDPHPRFDGAYDEIQRFSRDFYDMARELKLLYENLQDQVEEKTGELSSLNEQLRMQADELSLAYNTLRNESDYRNEFFAIMSHELRTPLTSILAFARILKQSDLNDKDRESVIETETNANILLNMVNNILSISKAEAGSIELILEPVDFVDLSMLVKKTLNPLARNKDIELTVQTDADVPLSMADGEKLRRIMDNLTDNAIKYTSHGGHVGIHVSFDPTLFDGGGIAIEVSDDGSGIDEDDQAGIFDIYQQSRHATSKQRWKGTGLGLAVVKSLSELHRGKVSVQSAIGKGSAFRVEIPYVEIPKDMADDA